MGSGKQAWGWYPAGKVWVPMQVAATGKLVIDPTALFENPPTNGEDEKAPQSDWAYDHWKDPYAHQDTGGKCGINVETLAAARTLTPRTDYIHQYLNPNGVTRSVYLATVGAVAGDRFIIKNTDVYTSAAALQVLQVVTTLDYVYARSMRTFIYNGTLWVGADIATQTTIDDSYNLSIGRASVAYARGVAIGGSASAHDGGFALGTNAIADNLGLAIGISTDGRNSSVALGRIATTQNNRLAIALGLYSYCTRAAETTIDITGVATHNYVKTGGRYAKATADATPIEMFLGGAANQRFTIKASSALAFRITVVARDNVAGDVAMYTFEGLIKRDAANNTVMSVCNKTIVHEDDATWDCNVTANDVNEALAITVTGDATNPVQWAGVLEGVETVF